MDDNEIEISIGVKIEAGIYFNVDRAEWAAMSDADKLVLVNEKLDATAAHMANDTFPMGEARFSGMIIGPTETEVTLDEVQTYDPQEA